MRQRGATFSLDGLRGVFVLTVAAAVTVISVALFLELPARLFGDADWYASGLPALTGSDPLYPEEWLGPHLAVRPPRFNLPPAVVWLSPLASLGRWPWGLLMAACLAAGLHLLKPRLQPRAAILLALGLTAFWPVLWQLTWANVNALVFLLLAIAWRWRKRSGWALGAAAAVKAAPIFALAVLIGRRDWRQLKVAVLVGLGLTLSAALVAGPEVVWQFVQVQLHETHPDGRFVWSVSDVLPEAAGWALGCALAAVAIVRRGSWTFAVLACIVVVPTLFLHYWVWMLVPALGALRTRYPPDPVGSDVISTAGVRPTRRASSGPSALYP